MSELVLPQGYTPGPWERERQNEKAQWIAPVSRPMYYVAMATGVGRPEINANADLIALAPEMAVEIARLTVESERLRTVLRAADARLEKLGDATYHVTRKLIRAALEPQEPRP